LYATISIDDGPIDSGGHAEIGDYPRVRDRIRLGVRFAVSANMPVSNK
jgi:hypothetical protein